MTKKKVNQIQIVCRECGRKTFVRKDSHAALHGLCGYHMSFMYNYFGLRVAQPTVQKVTIVDKVKTVFQKLMDSVKTA